jgi:hypothetical protein
VKTEIGADHRPIFSCLEKSQAISIMYEFAILFCVARHFGTELGTPKPAVFALEAATSVHRSPLFEPMIRSSF